VRRNDDEEWINAGYKKSKVKSEKQKVSKRVSGFDF